MIRIHLFDSPPFFDTPYQLIGWLGWFGMAAVILWVTRRHRDIVHTQQFRNILLLLASFSIISSVFIGFDLPILKNSALSTAPLENLAPTVMVFNAIPLILAAGMLGMWPAVLIGFISGIFTALWNTHSMFTPLEIAALGVILSWAFRQNYRSRFFTFLRKPFGAALITAVLSPLVLMTSTFFSTNGGLAARLDFVFTRSWIYAAIIGIELILGGLFCEILKVNRSKYWVETRSLETSPIATSLQKRIMVTALPLTLGVLLLLVIVSWMSASRAARELTLKQLEDSSRTVSENIPMFFEAANMLSNAVIDRGLPLNDTEKLRQSLQTSINRTPFFNQFFVFDLTGSPLTGYPEESLEGLNVSAEEQTAIASALNGVHAQNIVVQLLSGSDSATLSSITAIPDEYGLPQGVLVARTDLKSNLFAQPMLLAFENIARAGGQAVVLDDQNRVLFANDLQLLMTTYNQKIPSGSGIFDDHNSAGLQQLSYALINQENGWKVLLSIPSAFTQQLALQFVLPQMVISIFIALLVFLFLSHLMKTHTDSLVHLAKRADEIAKGELDHRIEIKGVDEIGRLGATFEQMRISLKSKLEELDSLLNVTQGIASNLQLDSSSSHLLNALLSYGADAASLVLLPNTTVKASEGCLAYRVGDEAETYAYLDQILQDQVRDEPFLIIPSKARIRRMGIPGNALIPSALAAIALNTGEEERAFIWVAYTGSHRFKESEIRFLNTLAGQALLAVTNSQLYMKAEIGKRRLESVLASTPEPVMVAGEDGSMLISNQAARQMDLLVVANQGSTDGSGEIVSNVLKEFITGTKPNEKRVEELQLEDNQIYLVSVSPVEVEGKHMGKVCMLRDVTEYRQLERMKSEYVSAVSHDLKAPLVLIRGYASMMPMVGDLNEQQRDYSHKILEGIDEITRMSDNLLDMRRIDSSNQLKIGPVSPAVLLDEVIKEIEPQIKHRKIQALRELTLAQDVMIEADQVLLGRALFNLMDNAIKFSPLGGKVNLRLQINDNNVVFEIQDHGPGIAPLDLPNLFSGKKQLNGEKENKEAGVGLAIVKTIAERHHGKVWANSILGKGSTFYLEIPRRFQTKSK